MEIQKRVNNNNSKKGYFSYDLIWNLGYIENLLDENILFDKIKGILGGMDKDKTYSLLPVIIWMDSESDDSTGVTIDVSVKVSNDISPNLLGKRIKLSIAAALMKYSINDSDGKLVIMGKEWLPLIDFNGTKEEVTKVLNSELVEIKKLDNKFDVKDSILESVPSLINYKNLLMDYYGTKIIENNKIIGYKINDFEGVIVNKFFNVTDDGNKEEFNFVYVTDVKEGSLVRRDDESYILKWKDIKYGDGFIREIQNFRIYFNLKGDILKIECKYNFPDFPRFNTEYYYFDKIGAIDFETYGNEGFGNQKVYAGGWCIDNKMKLFYINQYEKPEDVVRNTIESIFDNKDLNGYVFYAHNLGRFDSLFIIKSAVNMNNYIIDPIFKDNKIISMKIKNVNTKMHIKILDSLNLIDSKLNYILKDFGCNVNKGVFPYSFINNDRLFYKGKKPDIKYYDNININDYNLIPENDWNVQMECLNYLEKDLKGLLEWLKIYSNYIFNKNSINITSYKTLPSLSLAIFMSGFFNSNSYSIKMIKGEVEKDIRKAYFGGNVDVFFNYIEKGFYYDMNSQYPRAMLEDMPVGNPIFTTEKDLFNLFGFVYGEITAPTESQLRVPIIQFRNEEGVVSCPRGKFKRWIFTEEIKDAIINYGYSMNVEYGYHFERGKGVFNHFVNEFYDIKKNAKDGVSRKNAKLMLNSLYGKFGMKEIYSKIKIVDRKNAKFLYKNYNCSEFAELSEDKVLIKYSSRISENIRMMFKNYENEEEVKFLNSSNRNAGGKFGLAKKRGVPSAVHIAAAISSYSRILINKFKNIQGNECIMSDTDSVVLPYKLDDKFVGKEIGDMKLEYCIKHGLFIRKKLYYIEDEFNKVIIKSSGVDSKRLEYQDFLNLLNGMDVKTNNLHFNVKWKELKVIIDNKEIELKGLKGDVKFLLNTGNDRFITWNNNMKSMVLYRKQCKDIILYQDRYFNSDSIREDNIMWGEGNSQSQTGNKVLVNITGSGDSRGLQQGDGVNEGRFVWSWDNLLNKIKFYFKYLNLNKDINLRDKLLYSDGFDYDHLEHWGRGFFLKNENNFLYSSFLYHQMVEQKLSSSVNDINSYNKSFLFKREFPVYYKGLNLYFNSEGFIKYLVKRGLRSDLLNRDKVFKDINGEYINVRNNVYWKEIERFNSLTIDINPLQTKVINNNSHLIEDGRDIIVNKFPWGELSLNNISSIDVIDCIWYNENLIYILEKILPYDYNWNDFDYYIENNFIDNALLLMNEYLNLNNYGVTNNDIFLKFVNNIFPHYFKDSNLRFDNNNAVELIIKVIFNKLLMDYNLKRDNESLFKDSISYSKAKNWDFKLKIFFLNSVRPGMKSSEMEIDYNNIYLIISNKEEGKEDLIYYGLDTLKKKNKIVSRRNKNIVNKFLFWRIGMLIKAFYIDNNINIKDDIFNEYLNYLNGLNLMEIISVRPNNRFFNSKFIPNIKHDKLDLSNKIYTKEDINFITKEKEKYIHYDVNFNFGGVDDNNILERNILFS